jgi:hypothetical protein
MFETNTPYTKIRNLINGLNGKKYGEAEDRIPTCYLIQAMLIGPLFGQESYLNSREVLIMGLWL